MGGKAAIDIAVDMNEIERVLYNEADCLDRADLDSWIEMYTDDGTYWMPAAEGQEDPHNHISIMYDDRLLMEIRRRNFGHPASASMEHKLRCSHIISNIRVGEHDQETGDCIVTSNFLALMMWKDKRMFGGRYTHHLKRTDGGYRIRHKRVDLIDCDAPQISIIIYL